MTTPQQQEGLTIDLLYKNTPAYIIDHQIRSFDVYLLQLLPNIIKEKISSFILQHENSPYIHVIQLEHIQFEPTLLTAQEARLRRLTLQHPVQVDIRYNILQKVNGDGHDSVKHIKGFLFRSHPYMDLAVMLGSLNHTSSNQYECHYDAGGYFIVNGNERVLISQEKIRNNQFYVKKVYKQQPNTSCSYDCELRSSHGDKCRATSTLHLILNRNQGQYHYFQPLQNQQQHSGGGSGGGSGKPSRVHVVLPFMSSFQLPLYNCFCLFGFTDKSIIEDMILGKHQHDSYSNEKSLWNKKAKHILREVLFCISDSEAIGLGEKECSRGGIAPWKWLAQIHYKEKYQEMSSVIDLKHLFNYEVLPHLSIAQEHEQQQEEDRLDLHKALTIAQMARALIFTAAGLRSVDDVDEMTMKQINSPGYLMGLLTRQLHSKFMKAVKNECEKLLDKACSKPKSKAKRKKEVADDVKDEHSTLFILPIGEVFYNHHKTITMGLRYSMSNGNWSTRLGGVASSGVCQQLTRSNLSCFLSHLRCVNTQAPRSSKSVKSRLLRHSQRGTYCPTETPEGDSCGLLKALSLKTHVRVYYDHSDILRVLRSYLQLCSLSYFYPSSKLTPLDIIKEYMKFQYPAIIVYLNSAPVGKTFLFASAPAVIDRLKQCQQQYDLPYDILFSISGSTTVSIDATDGTLLQMQMHKKPQQQQQKHYEQDRTTIYELLVNRQIEFRLFHEDEDDDSKEEEQKQQREGELEMGSMAAYIPFPNHNQAPRNIYQCSMGKQSISAFVSTFQHRADTLCHVLHYPQKPLAVTKFEQCMDPHGYFSAGTNAIVLICNFSVFTDDDACVLNQSSVDRGLFMSLFTRNYYDHEKRSRAENHYFKRPDDHAQNRRLGKYDLLNTTDGVIDGPGSVVAENTALIGKVSVVPTTDNDATTTTDKSTLVKTEEPARVDQVYLTSTRDGQRAAGVRTLSTRIPEIGDKFSSRHGQKGVCAMLYRQEDLPRTAEGISPDIIINPHCWTRMTIGAWIEMLTGKASALTGKFQDGTAFQKVSVDDIGNVLKQHGFQKRGNERMYCGMTGRRLEGDMFIGPCFYQRLKHFVVDKMHARARGPRAVLTRQPVPGRARDGGLRVGEMETTCLTVHGAAGILRDRLFYASDYYRCYVCTRCGYFLDANGFCHKCCSNDFLKQILMPYAGTVLVRELHAMNIDVKLIVQ